MISTWANQASAAAISADAPAVPRAVERIAVLHFVGPSADIVRAAVVDSLVEGGLVEVVPAQLVEGHFPSGGSPWTHGSEVMRQLRLLALIHGNTGWDGRHFTTALTLMGANGAELGRLIFSAVTLTQLHSEIRAAVWVQTRPLLDRARALAGPIDSLAATGDGCDGRRAIPEQPRSGTSAGSTPRARLDEEAASKDRPSPLAPPGATATDAQPPTPFQFETRPGARLGKAAGEDGVAPRNCALLGLEFGGGLAFRAFNYRSEERGALRGYLLSGAPLGRVEATVHPFARACGVAGALGVRLAYERMAAGIDSKVGGRALSTEAFAYQAELVGRIPVGRWLLTPAVGYHARTYGVGEDVVPRVDHRAVGGSVDVQRRVGILVLEVGGGARWMISAGQLGSADWFPDQAGMTYAGRFRVGGAMTDWLDLMLGLYVEYTSHEFNIRETGAYPNGVAAGAYDAYTSTLLSLRLHLPGVTTAR